MKTKSRKIILMFLSAFLLTTLSFSQQDSIITTATSIQTCPGSVVVPIRVEKFIGVASISLGLYYDQQNLTYTGFQNVHPQLAGMFFVNDNGGQIMVSWFGFTPCNIPDDTIFELLFTYNNCEALLHWNVEDYGSCQYTDLNIIALPAIWIDGTVSSLAITTQASDTTVAENSGAGFSVIAPGATSYQWQESTNGLTWTNLANTGVYSGVTTNT
ncbi:MAG: hypothetical protein K8S00_10785, partial [Bacteroidales bacterium]|nr:hypothetical protein [Bacteroidales bacterium]